MYQETQYDNKVRGELKREEPESNYKASTRAQERSYEGNRKPCRQNRKNWKVLCGGKWWW